MPVAAQVGGIDRYHDDMSEAAGDVPVAARAEVRLHGLVGLDEADLEVAERFGVLHRSADERPEHEEHTHDQGGGDVDDVGGSAAVGPLRVESHASSIARPATLLLSGACSGYGRCIAPTVMGPLLSGEPPSGQEGIRCDTDSDERQDDAGTADGDCGSRCWHCSAC